MNRASIFTLLWIFISLCSSVYGAEPIDDRGTGTVNHNYYAAAHDPFLKSLLINVETNHMYASPYDQAEGVIGNIRNGKLDWAFGDLQYILQRFVNHPKALNLMGVVARLRNDPFLPIEFYERAIRLYPGYAFTHAQYGSYLVDIGNLPTGIVQLQKAIELDQNLALAYAGLARAYSKSGKSQLARQAAEKAKELGYRDKLLEQDAGG